MCPSGALTVGHSLVGNGTGAVAAAGMATGAVGAVYCLYNAKDGFSQQLQVSFLLK
jgi:hypothetical protein